MWVHPQRWSSVNELSQKGRIWFIVLRIPKFIISYFVWFYIVPKFEELVPATEDAEEKIKSFLTLLEVKWSFKFEQSNFQESSYTSLLMSTCKDPLFTYSILRILNLRRSFVIFIGSKATCSSALFALSDLEEAMSSVQLMLKRKSLHLLFLQIGIRLIWL